MPQVTIEKIAGVYIILHTASGKAYVGESSNIKGRWKSHFTDLVKNKHKNTYLQNAWNRHGATAFEFKLFLKIEENLSPFHLKKRLREEEVRVLALFPDHYNLTEAGDGGMICSEESKKKMGTAIKHNWKNNPSTVSQHFLAIMAAWQNPEGKAARIAAFNTAEGKQNRAAGASLGWEKRREKLKNDKEFLEKHKESRAQANKKIKELCNTPEGKAKLSEQARQTWQVEGRKDKVSKSLKEFYNNPENRRLHSGRMKKAFSKDN